MMHNTGWPRYVAGTAELPKAKEKSRPAQLTSNARGEDLTYHDFEALAKSGCKSVKGGKADIFRVIFNPGNRGFLRMEPIGQLLLCQAGFLPGLAKDYPNFELLIPGVKAFSELGIAGFAVCNISP